MFMKKIELLKILEAQKIATKKSTRVKVIDAVIDCVSAHIENGDTVEGLSLTRSGAGVNLGDVMEVVCKKVILKNNGINSHELARDLTKKVIELNRDLTPIKKTKNGVDYKNGARDMSKAVYDYVVKHDHLDRKGDIIINNISYEIKFSTSDAPATPLKNTRAQRVLIISWTALGGGVVFECEPQNVAVDNRGRVINNQQAKYINKTLTSLMFE